MGRFRRIASSLGSSLLLQARNLVISLVVFRLFADPAALWGVVNAVLAVVTVLSLPAKFGLEFTAVQYVSKYREDSPTAALAALSQATALRLAFTLAIALPLLLFPYRVAPWIFLGDVPELVRVAGWLLISTSLFEYGSWVLSGTDNFTQMMMTRLVYTLANIGGIAWVAWHHAGAGEPGAVVWAQVLAGAAATAWAAVAIAGDARKLRRRAHELAGREAETPPARELLRGLLFFSVPVAMVTAAGQVFEYVSRILIPVLSSHEELGSFAVASSVVAAALFGSYAFRNIARTRLPAELRRDPAEARRTLLASYRASFGISTWIAAGALVVAPDLLVALYTEEASDAARMLRWFVPYIVLSGHANFSATALVAADRPRIYAILMGALSGLTLLLDLLLIPRFGGFGAIAASTLSLVPLAVLSYREVSRAYGSELWSWRTIAEALPTTARLTAIGCAAAVPAWFVTAPDLVRSFAAGVLLTAIFGVLLVVTGELRAIRRAM